MTNQFKLLITAIFLSAATSAFADLTIPLSHTSEQGSGPSAGTVTVSETEYGLLFTPNLQGLKPGLHGFHVHEKPACGMMGMDAGGHFDPAKTGKHLGPYNNNGHLGDLPVLFVNADGTATLPILAPRLKHISDIKNHALMEHEGGDNYSDTPAKLGGGGPRMACGVIA